MIRDDSTRLWNQAGDVGDNGAAPWGYRPDVSQESHWIWTADSARRASYLM